MFRDLYHHILPQFDLMGRNCALVLEPIYILTVQESAIVDWRLVDQYIDPAFDILEHRKEIADGLRAATGSNLEQILVPVDTDVFVLWDNPLEFPGERLSQFIRHVLPSESDVASSFSGYAISTLLKMQPTGKTTGGPWGRSRERLRDTVPIASSV